MAGHARVLGATLLGIEGIPVEVEARISSQLPRIDIVGLPEAAVRESAARVRAAVQAIGLPFPDRRITINLAPAALRKQGAGLDLAVAVGILAAGGTLPPTSLEGVGLVGELALDGRLRPVRGALSQAACLRAAGCSRVILPASHAGEAGLLVEPPELARHLGEVIEKLATGAALELAIPREPVTPNPPVASDLGVVRGQREAKRALLIAAAGGHGLLLRGAPGAGKTLLARCLPGLLPPLSGEERFEVARIHDAAGLASDAQPVHQRPFRAPHHSATRAGLLGGGPNLSPGEVTLAHRGVLFLDELPEFDRSALESLRQILEEGRVVHARAVGRITLDACFQLIAAANP
ncbi:MAG: ATP-binding protein [bacterium]|nr:ATP-binding protein [bacterium]